MFGFKDYSISENLLRKLEELDSIRHPRPRYSKSDKPKSTVLATVSIVRVIVDRRLAAGFHSIRKHFKPEFIKNDLSRVVALTKCAHCGAKELSLLTSSTREHPSPTLLDKIRMLLPSEARNKSPIAVETRYVPSGSDDHSEGLENLSSIQYDASGSRWDDRSLIPEISPPHRSFFIPIKGSALPIRLFNAVERLQKLTRVRLQHSFDVLYVTQLPKTIHCAREQSLTFEFIPEEFELTPPDAPNSGCFQPTGEKLYNISIIEQSEAKEREESFTSDEHILKSIDQETENLLFTSLQAATKLLMSRVEKVANKRLGAFFEKMSYGE